MIKIKNKISPTTIFPPTTNVPNVSTTPPASPCERIARVVDTFNPSRYNVSNNKREGKTENWRGSVIFIETSKTNNARVIFKIINILRSQVGNGMINMETINMTLIKTDKSLADIRLSPLIPASEIHFLKPSFLHDKQTQEFRLLL
jgi:RNA polymerase subunit RPABC4/transcription elongation factor Spt4